MKVALTAALVALALGCNEPNPTRRPRGLNAGEEQPLGPVPAPAPAAPEPPPRAPSSLPSPFLRQAPDPGALSRPPDAGAEAVSAPADAGGPPRDLPAELRALLEPVSSCVDFGPVASAGGKLTVSVVAQVVPSGRITRASVTAPGQPATALRCLEQRATSAGLRGPIPGAPLQVTATLPIEVIVQPPPR